MTTSKRIYITIELNDIIKESREFAVKLSQIITGCVFTNFDNIPKEITAEQCNSNWDCKFDGIDIVYRCYNGTGYMSVCPEKIYRNDEYNVHNYPVILNNIILCISTRIKRIEYTFCKDYDRFTTSYTAKDKLLFEASDQQFAEREGFGLQEKENDIWYNAKPYKCGNVKIYYELKLTKNYITNSISATYNIDLDKEDKELAQFPLVAEEWCKKILEENNKSIFNIEHK